MALDYPREYFFEILASRFYDHVFVIYFAALAGCQQKCWRTTQKLVTHNEVTVFHLIYVLCYYRYNDSIISFLCKHNKFKFQN